jgi:hypothetical protein
MNADEELELWMRREWLTWSMRNRLGDAGGIQYANEAEATKICMKVPRGILPMKQRQGEKRRDT